MLINHIFYHITQEAVSQGANLLHGPALTCGITNPNQAQAKMPQAFVQCVP
jgi:hypothetical protein